MKKDIIYIDIEDEITSIIEKVRASDNKIVALVLPKRATVFQSIVNMRLLKHTAEAVKKSVVLITAETGLLPLAGTVGLHVARNLQTKPEIPAVSVPQPMDEVASLNDMPLTDRQLDPNRPVGELAGMGAAAQSSMDDDETIELDTPEEPEAVPVPDRKSRAADRKNDKKLAVPNFDKFRLKIILGVVALVLLIGGYILGFVVLPKASVTIKADIKQIAIQRDITVSPVAKEFDLVKAVVPAENKELKKPATEKFAATGEKDEGTKAAGTVTVVNCTNDTVTIPAGTGVSSGDLTFLTKEEITVPASDGVIGTGACKKNGTEDVDVTAQAAGDKYNLSARDYSIAGQSTSVTASGEAMSGGTSKLVKVVSAQDFEAAKAKLLALDAKPAKAELSRVMTEAGFKPLEDTFVATPGPVSSSPQVDETTTGDAVASVETTYTMLGVKVDDLKAIIIDKAKDQYSQEHQKIYNDGVDGILFKGVQRTAKGDATMQLFTTLSTGPALDENAIKSQVAGQKKGESKTAIESRPGIKEATISYSPFWVYKAPKNQSKISVNFEVPDTAIKPSPEPDAAKPEADVPAAGETTGEQ
jgi:hypothetical protein